MNRDGTRSYVYTAIDVFSRYGYAELSTKANTHTSTRFLKHCLTYFSFPIKVVQTDNGAEFGLYFTKRVKQFGLEHRHIHVRSPNENGHLERFNRTLQEEPFKFDLCLRKTQDLLLFLKYYNTERMHMGIHFKTPQQML